MGKLGSLPEAATVRGSSPQPETLRQQLFGVPQYPNKEVEQSTAFPVQLL